MDFQNLVADEQHIMDKHFTSGRGGHQINKVVIHHNAGNLSLRGIYDVWQNRQASAHYQVDTAGRVGQYVWDQDTAWHAGDWVANCQSIGVEHANSAGTGPLTAETLETGAHLVAAICHKFGLGRPAWRKNVFPHFDFTSTSCPGHLASSQHADYMRRAGEWYDAMSGGTAPAEPQKSVTPKPAPSAPKAISEVAQEVINGQWGNGEDRQARLQAAGYDYGQVQAEVNRMLLGAPAPTQKSIGTVAQEVIDGQWGNGDDRVNRLRSAGYDYNAVQAEVNRRLGFGAPPVGKTINQIANEVIAGYWGNGDDRVNRLRNAGYDYNAVQARVNQILGF